MEHEHQAVEDELGHTNDNCVVGIASSCGWNRSSSSGSSAPYSINKMMTDTDKDNDNHGIKGCGGSDEMTTPFTFSSAFMCDSHSDNHRLKKTSTSKRSHNSYHHDDYHRRNVIVSGRTWFTRSIAPAPAGALKMILLLSVVFLVGGVSPASSSSSLSHFNSVDDKDHKFQRGSVWNNVQDDGRGRMETIQGMRTVEDINLIEDDQQMDFNDPDNNEHYTHQWAVHILGGPEVSRRLAERHEFNFHGEIFKDYYHLTHARVAKRSIEPHTEYHIRLASEPEVRWLKQQTVKSRKKRDFLPEPMALSASSPSSGGSSSGGGKSGRSRAARRSKSIILNDPRWPAMWYLNRGGGLDMNVLEAWNEGITGKGIVVTILDDGLEKDHPDIVRNYDPMASFDVNSLDMDPMPTYDLTDSNRHGTRCAGEVAAEANNSICAVGIAYEAGVGGVRMLDGDVTDAVEARSLSHNPQHIDIYSASWGPDDDGKTVDGPGELATRAFIEGVTKGRNGRGSIFVWASGNGGRDHDNCNCDGYTNSIWTLSISSATENGLVPWYSEACSSTLATTYSSGGTGEKQIVTIDLHHSCTSSHTGTSASAPLAAGICALALQANTNLTWRDMQHIVVRTARPQHLMASDWATNGVGRNVSHSFGYGLMDAGAMVKLSKKWKMVPPQHKCEIKAPYTDKNIPSKSKVTLDLKVTNCPNVNYLEHVQAKVTLTSGRRGDLQIFLVSPSGTRSQLLAHRRHDLNRAGFTDWPFMTVHSWGESPIGKWTLEIHNEGRYTGKLQTWTLIAHGIPLNPNDQGDDSGIGGGGSTKGSDGQQGTDASASGNTAAVVEFDGSDNTIVLESSSSQLHNSPPLAAHAGEAKPVSIVGRPESPASPSSAMSGCAKMSTQGQCLECVPGLALLHAGCVSQCPATFFVESRGHPSLQPDTEDSSNSIHYACLPCHYSCQSCSGPNDDECVTCHGDAKLHRVSAEEGDPAGTDKAHCYPTDLLAALDSSGVWHRILLAGVALSIIFILSMLSCLCCDCWSNGKGVDGKPGYEDSGHPTRQGWLTKGGQAQPYKMISREEIDDDDDDEESGYEYYDDRNRYKGSKPRSQSKQTNLELISEDEEEYGSDSFEKVATSEEHNLIQTEIRAPGMAEQIKSSIPFPKTPKHSTVISPTVPLIFHSHSASSSRHQTSNNSPSSSSTHSYTEGSRQSDQSQGPLA
ncbi:unnamed protein product [Orchesella dallaii]|uniref:P/Homo B domain-containing protein n=1 Tax=Orchesella dallaii TaxID=48710 RepID=A0ABP1Q2V7_9HEXA